MIGRVHLAHPQGAQNIEAAHVRQIQVQQDQVVVIDLAQIHALFAKIRRVDVEAFRLQHQLDGLRGGAVILDQQYAHAALPALGRHYSTARRNPPVKPVLHSAGQLI
jgi:hypothetical protein